MASCVSSNWTSVVVGAGVFGASTAWNLLQRREHVLLVDAWGAAHAHASSGGESRITRTAYGGDELYTRMAWESLPEWRRLSGRSPLPLFHQTGVQFWKEFRRETVNGFGRNDTFSLAEPGCQRCFRHCWARGYSQLVRKCSILLPRWETLVSKQAVCRHGRISTMAISITACQTWK